MSFVGIEIAATGACFHGENGVWIGFVFPSEVCDTGWNEGLIEQQRRPEGGESWKTGRRQIHFMAGRIRQVEKRRFGEQLQVGIVEDAQSTDVIIVRLLG